MWEIDMDADGLSRQQIINAGKFIRENVKKSRLSSKHKECLICGATSTLCDSHTVPKLCLRKIAVKGKLLTINAMVAPEILSIDSGIENSGIFRIICRPCDNTLFQDYEKSSAYSTVPNHIMLNQIALKNVLRDIHKHEAEIEMYKNLLSQAKEAIPELSMLAELFTQSQIEARSIDIKECYELFNKAKNSLAGSNEWIELYTYDKLNYVVPVAFQGMVALVTGLNGELINDIYNQDDSYSVEYLHIAVFPLENDSVVITFGDKSYSRINAFKNSLKAMSELERLKVINRIIFWYTEDYFLSPVLSQETLSLLQQDAKRLQETVTLTPLRAIIDAIKDYDLRRDTCSPILLSREYAVK